MKKADYLLKHPPASNFFKSTSLIEKLTAEMKLQNNSIDLGSNHDLLTKVVDSARELSEFMFTANPNLQKALLKIMSCLSRVFSKRGLFFKSGFNRPILFDTFSSKMSLDIQVIQSLLANQWPRAIW